MQTAPPSPDLPAVGEVDLVEVRTGPQFTLAHLGDAAGWRRYGVKHPAREADVMGKVFLKTLLGLTGLEISLNVMPARGAVPFLHSHRQNEEVYLFVRGRGQIQIDGEVLDVREGTAVRVAPGGARSWRNVSDVDLEYVVIQAKEGSLTAWTASDGVLVPGPVTWPG